MQFDEKVLTALEVLTDAAENDFELFRICTLVRDLIAPPKAEQVDDTHQRFNGVTYTKNSKDHYYTRNGIHRAIWSYYHGDIPQGGQRYDVHHDNKNPEDNSITNLVLMTIEEHQSLHMAGKEKMRRMDLRIQNFTCVECGQQFKAHAQGRNKFCSLTCRRRWYYRHRRKVIKTCEWCGKEFQPSGSNAYKQRFCSISCGQKARHNQHHRPAKKCPVCGKEFMPLSANYYRQVCCSRSCGQKYKNQRRKAKAESAQINLFDDNTGGENSQ